MNVVLVIADQVVVFDRRPGGLFHQDAARTGTGRLQVLAPTLALDPEIAQDHVIGARPHIHTDVTFARHPEGMAQPHALDPHIRGADIQDDVGAHPGRHLLRRTPASRLDDDIAHAITLQHQPRLVGADGQILPVHAGSYMHGIALAGQGNRRLDTGAGPLRRA